MGTFKNYRQINIDQNSCERDSFVEERYRQCFSFFPKNTIKVLDVGCGIGKGGAALKNLNSRLMISGIDVLKERLDRIPAGIYENKFLGSCIEIPCKDKEFDIVIAAELIEHIFLEDVNKVLYEFFRVLKNKGRFLLTTPNPADIKRKARKESILGGAHVSEHCHKELSMRLRRVGFSSIKIYGSGKTTRYLGYRFPLLWLYGSYLIIGDKP